MAIEIIPSIKGCLDAVEASIAPFDENNLSFGLEALVDDSKSLTDNERTGCRAEIFGLRFITASRKTAMCEFVHAQVALVSAGCSFFVVAEWFF